MGDRANCVVDDNGKRVWFYTHWRGTELPALVQTGLRIAKSANRLDDAPYFARIIFDAITAGDKGPTGFGISTEIGDNEHPIIILDLAKQQVRLEGGRNGKHAPSTKAKAIPFEEYIGIKEAHWVHLDSALHE